MSIRYDFHMHTSFSTDSDAPMEQMVLRAMEQGLSGICFTDHMDLDYPEEPGAFEADPAQVLAEVTRLRRMYDHRFCTSHSASGTTHEAASPHPDFEIAFGLEFGMQAHLPDRFAQIAAEYPLDFIPASCHLVDGRDPYLSEVWGGRTADAFIRRYYETYYENIRQMREWDTLAHLDYIIRYIPEEKKRCPVYDSLERHADLVDALLRYVIDQGKCLEVNTAGFKYGLGQPHPSPAILKRYRELGGERITIGSDAHAPEHIGVGFRETEELLLGLGFKAYTVFRARRGREIALV